MQAIQLKPAIMETQCKDIAWHLPNHTMHTTIQASRYALRRMKINDTNVMPCILRCRVCLEVSLNEVLPLPAKITKGSSSNSLAAPRPLWLVFATEGETIYIMDLPCIFRYKIVG